MLSFHFSDILDHSEHNISVSLCLIFLLKVLVIFKFVDVLSIYLSESPCLWFLISRITYVIVFILQNIITILKMSTMCVLLQSVYRIGKRYYSRDSWC